MSSRRRRSCMPRSACTMCPPCCRSLRIRSSRHPSSRPLLAAGAASPTPRTRWRPAAAPRPPSQSPAPALGSVYGLPVLVYLEKLLKLLVSERRSRCALDEPDFEHGGFRGAAAPPVLRPMRGNPHARRRSTRPTQRLGCTGGPLQPRTWTLRTRRRVVRPSRRPLRGRRSAS